MTVYKLFDTTVIYKVFIALLCILFIAENSFANDDLLSQGGEAKIADSVTNDKQSSELHRTETAQRYFDQISDVLDREEFGRTEYVKAWRLIDQEDKEARKEKFPEWIIKILEWFESRPPSDKDSTVGSGFNFALILEVILWGGALVLVLFVIIKYRENLMNLASLLRRTESKEYLPTTMFGLDIKKESLPDDIIGSAEQYWQEGESRLAIAMLLRASLINLLNDHHCRFYDSDTESECCLRIDKQVSKPLSGFMQRLVAVWQQVAYAHKIPSKDDFDLLCKEWQEVFS